MKIIDIEMNKINEKEGVKLIKRKLTKSIQTKNPCLFHFIC